MGRGFIELYDDDGYRYIVNIDKISFVNVAGKKVWAGEVAALAICDESMDRLLSRLVGDGDQVLPVLRRGALGERGLCENEVVSD